MLDINKYVQELLANTVEAMVEMYELPSGDMSVDQGAELAIIGGRLAVLLKEFVNSNK